MAEYIEREKAIEYIESHFPYRCSEDFVMGQQDCIEQLKSLPTADVVEVVRCSECKHRDKIGLCQAEGQKLTIVKDNHFCSKGEKRTSSDEALSPKTKQAILDDFMKNSEQ